MNKLKLIFIPALFCLSVVAQSPQSEMKHFAKGGLAFDYPAGWALADRSTPQVQHLVIALPTSSALIMLIAHGDTITSLNQLLAARSVITEPFTESVAEKFRAGGKIAERDSLCTEVGELKDIGGIRLRGSLNQLPSTGEVYSFLMGRRFVNLIYIRADKDDAQGRPAWDTIRSTLQIETPALPPGQVDDPALLKPSVVSGGVLNGKALSLPKPQYPDEAKRARAGGTVTVKVTIDEQGKVISARAISGHNLLQPASIEAAKRAKFSPTLLCGQPVKVTGVITYNYVVM